MDLLVPRDGWYDTLFIWGGYPAIAGHVLGSTFSAALNPWTEHCTSENMAWEPRTRAGSRHSPFEARNVQIPRLGSGSLSVSLSVLCSNHDNVMCWDHTGRATAFPNSAGKKKNRAVRQPNVRAVAFSWSLTELVNDAEEHICGVFGEDLLQEHEQSRRRLSGTLCVRSCSFYLTKSCNATTVRRPHATASRHTHTQASESVDLVNDEQRLIVWKIVVWSGALPVKSWRGFVGKKGRKFPFRKYSRWTWRMCGAYCTPRRLRRKSVCNTCARG